MVVQVQRSPIHKLDQLDALLKSFHKKTLREALMAMGKWIGD